MIHHSVFFTLKHELGSEAEKLFLQAAQGLAQIQGVRHFQVLKEVSPKNAFTFGLAMAFADQSAYDFYNQHPSHVNFVETRWIPEVADFMEIDYVALVDEADSAT